MGCAKVQATTAPRREGFARVSARSRRGFRPTPEPGYICEPASVGREQNRKGPQPGRPPRAALARPGQKWRPAMRHIFIALCMSLLCAATAAPAHAAVSVSIGINVPVYPQMVVVPGYPVYYAPTLRANFFFYDGMYWVLEGDNWYM